MEFHVLGRVEAERDGASVALGSYKQRSVLALLLIHANNVVSTDRIIDELWGDEAGGDRQNALWVHVSNLRTALEPSRGKRSDGTLVLTRAPGYILQLGPEQLDVWRFERLLQEGRALLDTDPAAASVAIGEGLAMWRGQPYEDFAYERFAESEISRLEELRFEAVELRVEADLRQGLAAELVGELEGLARQHPLREHLTSLLMMALYRAGRRADALRAYARLRARLAGELGLEPSAPLCALEAQILIGDPALDCAGSVPSHNRLSVRGYELRDEIGGGSVGRAYRAYQPVIGREVAIKVIRPELADDPAFIRRFEADAERVARLDHPHIVPLYDYWREPGAAYVVTRLFRGGSLNDILGRGPLETTVAAEIVDEVGSALALAHHHGVVHGDVKPENILFDDDHHAYLGDFGIATADRPAADESSCTAPEVQAGGPPTAMADVYGLGAVLAFALTGITPGDLPAAIAALPPAVGPVIRRATAADPAARYPDAAAFAEALRRALGAALVHRSSELENPYKGLLAFDEADAQNFFGRARQLERLLVRLGEPGTRGRFVAVVGPSGSGKSSVVSAGVLPALRRGALPGSAQWFVVSMTPASHPFEELDAALRRIAVNPPATSLDELTSGPAGIRRAVRRVLPDDRSPLLLVIDQFEELFTQTSDATAAAFLDALATAVEDQQSHLRVIVTLRADFYDRPLGHRRIGELVRIGTEVITPMSQEELEQAIDGPAARLGVQFEPRLVAEIVADVADRSGALPLMQYALTELFDRRHGPVIESSTYRAMGRVSGALVRRAEELYAGLDPDLQSMTRQVMLRLVSLGDDVEGTRRRVLRSELSALGGPRVDAVLDTFGSHRLLSFDRDPITRGPTVEIAHEALLSAWERLRDWIDDSREEVRQQRRLAAAAAEWQASGHEPGYLLHGSQLDQAAAWAAETDLSLHPTEQAFLDASVARRDQERSAEQHRQEDERRLRRKTRVRTGQLIGSAVVIALVAGLAAFAGAKGREASGLSAKLAATDESRRLATASTSMARSDPELATLLALQALDMSGRHGQPALREAVDALHWAIQGARLSYPGRDAPAAVRIGPDGPTGTFDLPLAQLVALARSHLSRTLTPAECADFQVEPCPVDGTGLASPAAAGPRAAPTAPAPLTPAATGTPLAGTTVNIVGGPLFSDGLTKELTKIEHDTGIHIFYREDISPAVVERELQENDPPDIIFTPSPAAIQSGGRNGELVALDGYLDTTAVRKAYGDYLTNALSIGATLYGLPVDLNAKGIVWYPKPEFDAAGYTVPTTWDQLISLTEKMVADGEHPWCVGFASGQASGWPGTDWIEALVLRVAGVDAYDQWIAHELPFDSAPVREAMRMFGDIVFPAGFVQGGSQSISRRQFQDSVDPMFANPPGCWLYHYGSVLVDGQLPPGALAGVDVGFFVLPGLTADGPAPLFGGGEFAAAFKDRPEVREVMRRILDPGWGAQWAAAPNAGFLPANSAFDPENCRPSDVPAATADLRVQLCRVNRDAVASGRWRFDASDLMPVGIGSGAPAAFWKGMLDYVDQGPQSAEAILKTIDADPHWMTKPPEGSP